MNSDTENDWEYKSFACMECGNDSDIWEEVDTGFGGPFELWVYCHKCDVESFHPRVPIHEDVSSDPV